jgi:hypothetical protein
MDFLSLQASAVFALTAVKAVFLTTAFAGSGSEVFAAALETEADGNP